MGYGLIEVTGSNIRLIDMNVLKLSSGLDAYEKLEKIHNTVVQLITEYKPGSFAIEAPFFGKNIQSMLKLGRAQGVAIAAAMQSGGATPAMQAATAASQSFGSFSAAALTAGGGAGGVQGKILEEAKRGNKAVAEKIDRQTEEIKKLQLQVIG